MYHRRHAVRLQAFHGVGEQHDLPDPAFAAVGIRHGDHFVVRQTAHRHDRGWSELERDRWIQTQYLQTSSGNCIHFHAERHDLCAVLLHAWHMEGKERISRSEIERYCDTFEISEVSFVLSLLVLLVFFPSTFS